jgi:hypothetical protein
MTRPQPRGAVSKAVSKMVGREAALGELQACFEKILRGQRQIIFVAGEPGIGKTTLVSVAVSQRGGFGHKITKRTRDWLDGRYGAPRPTCWIFLSSISPLIDSTLSALQGLA